ncbi:MAG: ribulose-phosphate 3-epimerase [Patescibacteria group bacterium]
MKKLISASILSSDFGKLNEEIASVEPHVDMIHVDVMDGHFVPNITLGAPVVAKMKCGRPMEVHLMIEHPEKFIEDFAKAISHAHGRKDDCYITVHQEVCHHPGRIAEQIKKAGCRAAISINPETPLATIESVLADFDMVLIMTVHPGFGGQGFIEECLPKIEDLRNRAPKMDIAVDGGINDKTAGLAAKAGANIFVAGSYIFKAENRAKAIDALR